MHFKSISIIGLGYIGLPTAAILANREIKVIGFDIDQKIVDTVNQGGIHIVEPGLAQAVHTAVHNGHLRATTQAEATDAFLIAVPTPFKEGIHGSHEPDLSYIEAATQAIAPVLAAGNLVVLESTSPVGTTEKMAAWLVTARPDLSFPQTADDHADIHIAYCPERVLPGQVLQELVHNDRIIGGMTAQCAQAAASLYQIFVEGECIITDARTAEMCKLTENSFRDVNIAFANELSVICDKLDMDVWELIRLANRHPRVNILQPGPGVGGHCIAVDPWFIVSKTPDEAKLIRTAREVNDSKPDWVVEKVKLAIADFLQANPQKTAQEVTIACFGLTFKPDIDDLRGSPALEVVEKITAVHPGTVWVVEPNIAELPAKHRANLVLTSAETALATADIQVLLVGHQPFKAYRPKGLTVDCIGLWKKVTRPK